MCADLQIRCRRASNVLSSWKPDDWCRRCGPLRPRSGEMSAPKSTFRQAQRRVCCQLTANIAEALKRGIDVAEGLLGRILGDEAEKPQVEVPEALASAEAFAAAVAAIASRQDPGVTRKTEEFLGEQTQLLKVQKEHLNDEHAATGDRTHRDLATTLWSV